MRVSVLIPTFNRGKYIVASLESVLSQTRPPSQVIVIDDGSTDDTRERLVPYKSSIEYVRQSNGGKASALNLGMQAVTGDYVWIFDDDDVAYPDALARHQEVLSRQSDVGFSYGNHDWGYEGPDGTIARRVPHPLVELRGRAMFLNLLRYCYFMLGGAVVRRTCYLEVGPFREDLLRSQDYDMLIRLARRFPGRMVPGTVYTLRRHEGTRGSPRERHDERDRVQVWRKYDRMIGREILQDLRLSEYLLNMHSEPLSTKDKREALLMRASVLGSKGMLDEMLEDLWAAALIEVPSPLGSRAVLSERESGICYAMIDHPTFRHDASLVPSFWNRLAKLRNTPTGPHLLAHFAKGLYWRSTGHSWHRTLGERVRLLTRAVWFAILSRNFRT